MKERQTFTLIPSMSTSAGGSMNSEDPQNLQNLWVDVLLPNMYSERLSDPCEIVVADRGWWTESSSA